MQDKDLSEEKTREPTPGPSLKIEKLVTGGVGLGWHEGHTVLVPLTAPGDEVRVRVERRKGRLLLARLEEVIEPAPERRPAPCPHFGECGGCDLQHLGIGVQRAAKSGIVADCLRRIGHLDITDILEDADADLPEFGYRTKLRLLANPAGHWGMMRRGSHDIVPLTTCRLVPEIFDATILPWLKTIPPAEQLVLRLDGRGGWLLSLYGPAERQRILKKIIGAGPAGEPPLPGCVGLFFNNYPIWGRDYLVVHCAGKKYRVSARSFFQNNLAVAERSVGLVRSWLSEIAPAPERLLDLYCGVGLFSLALADRFATLVAADTNPHAIADAQNNLRRDDVPESRATVVEESATTLLRDPERTPVAAGPRTCCVVNPPRVGLGKEVCEALVAAAPASVFYMSCDPATLARDARLLVDGGYELKRVKVLDMYPQSGHVEALVLLTRA